MNTQGSIRNTDKVRLLETEDWETLPRAWILKLFKADRKSINVRSNVDAIHMFSGLTSRHKFGAQELISLHFEYMYSIKIYGFMMIYGSETQIS